MATMVNGAERSGRIGRSIGAVVAGILAIFVLDNGIDFVLHGTGIYPPFGQPMVDGLFLLALAYRTLDGILGSYIAGRLAPRRPLAHALTLGGIGVVLSALGALATIGAGPEFGPFWYPLVLVVIALPCAWVGGRLASTGRNERSAPVSA